MQGEEERLQDEVTVGAGAALAFVVVVQHADLLPAEMPADLDDELGGFGIGPHEASQEAVLLLVFERLLGVTVGRMKAQAYDKLCACF